MKASERKRGILEYGIGVFPTQSDYPDLQEGFCKGTYEDEEEKICMPMLTAAVSREKILPLFQELLEPLGKEVSVYLERKDCDGNVLERYIQEEAEHVIVESWLWDFEELFQDDGKLFLAVVDVRQALEVHLDQHKLIHAFGKKRRMFQKIMKRSEIPFRQGVQSIDQIHHDHWSNDDLLRQFDRLRHTLALESY